MISHANSSQISMVFFDISDVLIPYVICCMCEVNFKQDINKNELKTHATTWNTYTPSYVKWDKCMIWFNGKTHFACLHHVPTAKL